MQLRSKKCLSPTVIANKIDKIDEVEKIKKIEKRKARTPTEGKRLKMHKLPITCLCIDSKNRHAFTASKDGSIIKWCLEIRKMLKKVDSIKQGEASKGNEKVNNEHHVKCINAIAISSDDKFLATGGWDKHIRIWSPDDLTWLHTFKLHRQEITALVFRRDHPTLYSASKDRSIMIWSLEDDENRCFVEALYGHESPITSIDSLRKERVITSGSLDQSIRLWKIVDQAHTVFQTSHRSVDIARFVDDKTFVAGGEDGSISLWTTMKRSAMLILEKAHGATDDAPKKENDDDPFSSNLSYWITSLAVYPLKKKSLSNGNPRKKRKLDESADDYDESEKDDDLADEELSTDPEDGAIALIASGSCDSKLILWNLIKVDGKYELTQIESFNCPGFINDLKFTSDGKRILAACGKEHRLGRWWNMNKVKNCLSIFDVNKLN